VKACVMFLFARRVRNSGAYDRSATVGRRGTGKAWPSLVPRGHESPCSPTDSFDSRPMSRPNMLLSVFGVEELSLLLLRPWNELSRLARQPWPDFGSGLGSRRRLGSMSGSRGGSRQSCRARPSGDAKSVHSAVPPKRLVRPLKRRRRASTRCPDSLYGVARPQPCGDLVLALEKASVRLVARRFRGQVICGRSLSHMGVIGFGGQKYVRPVHFSSSVERSGAETCCNSLSAVDTLCTSVRTSTTG